MIKQLLAAALVFNVDSSGYFPDTIPITNTYIEKIVCEEATGTGFKISDGRWVSVNHVTSLTNCSIDGLPIVVTYADEEGDLSIFTVPGDTRRGGIKVDCLGYQHGWYWSEGHANGRDLQAIPIFYSIFLNLGLRPRGWSILAYNRVIPGMSGGPVLNGNGEAVGTINAYGIYQITSFSRQLRHTPICKKD